MVKPMANPMVKVNPMVNKNLFYLVSCFSWPTFLSASSQFLAQVMKKPAAPLGRMAGLEKWDRKMFQPLDMDVGHPPTIGRS